MIPRISRKVEGVTSLRPWSLALVVVLAAVPAAVHAQSGTPDEDLAAIRELVLHATYRDALARTNTYLARTDLDARHRTAALEVEAIVQLALRDEAGARRTLATLYARDPGHRLEDPDASPVVQSAFARAREGATPLAVEITDRTDAAPATHGTPEVSVSLGANGDAVQELRVSYRRAGDTRWLTTIVSPDETGTASSPLATSSSAAAYEVEYHVEALSPSSSVIATLGSADAPLHIAVPAASAVADVGLPDEATPTPATGGGGVETEAWFWIVIGVVVVGAGVGIGVGVSVATTPTADDGSLGTVTLPLVSF
jgi:hypothetical protein